MNSIIAHQGDLTAAAVEQTEHSGYAAGPAAMHFQVLADI
jgi:hypothetical protein